MFHPIAAARRLLADAALRVAFPGDLEYLFRRSAARLGVSSLGGTGELGYFQGSLEDRAVLAGYLREKTWAPELQELFGRLFETGGTLIDVGANIGLTSVPISRARPVRCFAFEPDPENYRYLVSNIAANGATGVRAFNIALLAAEGPVSFERSADNMGDHRVRKGGAAAGAFGEDRRKVIQVQGRRLDEVLAREPLESPVVLKVDTQGAEVEVLKGATGLLPRVDVAVLEFWPYGLRRLGSTPQEFYDAIGAFSFGATLDEGPSPPAPASVPAELMPMSRLLERLRAVPDDGKRIDWVDILVSRRQTLGSQVGGATMPTRVAG